MSSLEGTLSSPVSYFHLFALNSWTVSCGFGWAVFFLLATPYFAMYGISPFWISFAVGVFHQSLPENCYGRAKRMFLLKNSYYSEWASFRIIAASVWFNF